MGARLARSPQDLGALRRPVDGRAKSLPNKVLGYRHRHAWLSSPVRLKGCVAKLRVSFRPT